MFAKKLIRFDMPFGKIKYFEIFFNFLHTISFRKAIFENFSNSKICIICVETTKVLL
jgi:hypothetical protein